MKRFLLIVLVLLFYLGCKNDAGKESLNEILREYEPKTQVFKVSSDTIIEIEGAKGTILKIAPGVLQHQDGSIVEGDIEVRLLELTNTEDLLKANAQTISDDKWLISGGAYNIQIFSEKKKLKIADGKRIEINFPKIASEDMRLFDGNRDKEGNMNWKLSDRALKNRKYPVVIQEDSSFLIFNRRFAIDMPVDSIVFRTLEEKLSVDQIRKDHQEIDSVIVKSDTLYAYIFSMRKLMSEMLSDSLLSWQEADELAWRKKATREDIFVEELYNTISIQKLGWINVDRFYPEIYERARFELVSDIEMDYAQLYAADAENNTLLNLYEEENGIVVFNAPIGKRFTIIAVGVKGEQTYGYKKSVLIESDTKHQIKYRNVDKKKMSVYFNLD